MSKFKSAYEMNEKELHSLVNRINQNYLDGCDLINLPKSCEIYFDRYEQLLEKYSRSAEEYNWLEDLATDTRMYGWNY